MYALKFSETTGPIEAKNHVAPPWDRGKDGKFIEWVMSFVVSHYCQPQGVGVFIGDIATNFSPQSGLWKLKS